jgi:hypothetical protein
VEQTGEWYGKWYGKNESLLISFIAYTGTYTSGIGRRTENKSNLHLLCTK